MTLEAADLVMVTWLAISTAALCLRTTWSIWRDRNTFDYACAFAAGASIVVLLDALG